MRIPTTMAAANGGGLPEEAVSEYDHRMAWVQQANGQVGAQGNSEANLALIENVRGWSELQKQLVTADLAHKWRIDAVTARYQAHMEKVRPSFLEFMPLYLLASSAWSMAAEPLLHVSESQWVISKGRARMILLQGQLARFTELSA